MLNNLTTKFQEALMQAQQTAGRLGKPEISSLDVLVALLGDWAIMTLTRPGELTLVGQHGSLTPEEMRVPLLIDQLTVGGTRA